jgi:hypothetical protein
MHCHKGPAERTLRFRLEAHYQRGVYQRVRAENETRWLVSIRCEGNVTAGRSRTSHRFNIDLLDSKYMR